MSLYNTLKRRLYTTQDYALYQGRNTNLHFCLKYDGGIFVVTYSSGSDPVPYTYLLGNKILYIPPIYDTIKGTVHRIPTSYTGAAVTEEDLEYSIHTTIIALEHFVSAKTLTSSTPSSLKTAIDSKPKYYQTWLDIYTE